MQISKMRLKSQIDRLNTWLLNNSYLGWDPYDAKGSPLCSRILSQTDKRTKRLLERFLLLGDLFFPRVLRHILGQKPRLYAKALGLILTANIKLYLSTGSKEYLNEALHIEGLLQKIVVQTKHGSGWGYPFHWNSAIPIPEGTPSSVVTSAVGEGYLKLFHATQDQRYLDICCNICEFFVHDLNRSNPSPRSLCFSYTPIDDFQVHNANLFVAAYLAQVGNIIKNDSYLELSHLSGNFALQQQQEEGFIPYWGLDQTEKYSGGKIRVDNYHSGFEIRMLHILAKETQDPSFDAAWRRYYHWYSSNFFDSNGIALLYPGKQYPINIHAVAEGILCQSWLLEEYPDRISDLAKLVAWSEEVCEFRDGQYIYMMVHLPIIGIKRSRIPMIRWGQAWMFRALSELWFQLDRVSQGGDIDHRKFALLSSRPNKEGLGAASTPR